MIIYLIVMLGAFLISEFVVFSGRFKFKDWNIKEPKKELYVIFLTQIITCFLLVYWFAIAKQKVESSLVKIVLFSGRILFVFPVFFIIYFVGIKKYSLRQLGVLSFYNWYVSLPIIILIGGVTYLTFPESLQFNSILKQNGGSAFLVLGFLTAAIPEEITRVLIQSRLSRVLKDKSWGWFLASFLWALLHIPTFAKSSGDYIGATFSALGILPIGLLWGYLNERYKSIIPSVLIHGTNLWGLQNIF
ncbi:CPBP family intramembrane glutamic endopeptidase [Tenacibaculum xiamenense]|uniref:CPBP family intramembrane glutamic endopeptidase n=1 Tax=Tenacibaculum xiamenense TaxID=1261553 RepID=UPI0038B618FB